MTKLIITVHNFANAPKNLSLRGIEPSLSSKLLFTLLTELSQFQNGHYDSDLLYYPEYKISLSHNGKF